MRLPVVALLLGGGFLFGCKSELDMGKLESMIAAEGKNHSWPIEKVQCPKKRAIQLHDRFTCQVELSMNQKLQIEIEQTDQQGTVRFVTKNVIALSKLHQLIQQEIRSQKQLDVQVKCPFHQVVVTKKNESFSCEAKSDKISFTIDVLPLDNEGRLLITPKGLP